MVNVFVEQALADDERRRRLYDGDIFVYGSGGPSSALCKLARDLMEEAFPGVDPRLAQHHYSVNDYVSILAKLKPRFIHHPRCKDLLPKLLHELGCDLENTYFDVPRLRSSTSDNYLTTGIAYAFHPHRDTWFSAPMCQINWWLPVYEMVPESGVALHVDYWSRFVKNDSAIYNYQTWVATSRFNAAQHIGRDTREQPKPEVGTVFDPQLRISVPPGGVMTFSAAQLHSTVENQTGMTRFSIDFRTVNIMDASALIGARNIDSFCTGTTMRDYLRGTDLSHIPESIVMRYMKGHPQEANGAA